MVVEGGANGAVFEGYLREMVVPALKEGDVMVMDNLSVHKSERVREMIEGAGAQILYLPPYSPDFNPIEEAFSKIKNLLRKAGARVREALVEAIGEAISRLRKRTREHSSSIAATVRRFNYYDHRCKRLPEAENPGYQP